MYNKLKIGDEVLFHDSTIDTVHRGIIINISTICNNTVADIECDMTGSIQGVARCIRPLDELCKMIEPMCIMANTSIVG